MIKFKVSTDIHPKLPVQKIPGTPTTEAAKITKLQAENSVPGFGDEEPVFQIKNFPQNHIKWLIHKNYKKYSAPRHHNVVHASDLDPARNWCPREPALLTRFDKKRPDSFTATAQAMTYTMGYKGADMVMDFIPKERLWGSWKCRACKHEMILRYKPEVCEKCQGHHSALRYVEVLLRAPAIGLIGSIDLFVDILGNGMKTPLEIKTEGNESFKARKKATFDHEWRTMLYLWLIEQSPELKGKGLNAHEARIIYVTKEGYADDPAIKEWKIGDWGKSAIKEYWVSRNDDMIEPAIAKVLAYRKWRNQFDQGGMGAFPYPDRICKSADETRAKNCSVCKECFQ